MRETTLRHFYEYEEIPESKSKIKKKAINNS